MSKYDRLYVNGDSYSAITYDDMKVYSEFLEERIPVKNAAIVGSNNERIFRSSTQHITANSIAIIGFSFITRKEIWYSDDNNEVIKVCVKETDKDFPGSKDLIDDPRFITLDKALQIETTSYLKQLVATEPLDKTKDVMDFYTRLMMFAGYLRSIGTRYFLFNAADNTNINYDRDFVTNTNAYRYVQSDPNILDIEDFSIRQYAEEHNLETADTYHLYEDGHEHFSQFLIKKVLDNL